MARTPLQDALLAQATNQGQLTALGEYRGAETAARFADPQEEFSGLLKGGIYDLGFLARLSIKGSDRVRWLNGMVTNNIRDLAVGHGVYAFLLNPQGRILADMHVFNRGEELVVETDHSQIEKISATFDHYIIMDDVEVCDVSAQQTTLGLAGPNSRAILNAVGIEVPGMQPLQMITSRCVCECECVECTVVRAEDAPLESYELWLAPQDVLKTWKALIAAGAAPIGSETLERLRIAAGIPLYGVDIRERDLPQETEQVRALNFNKGCYVGQEIVERIRSRGNVHRKFAGFTVTGETIISPGTKISSGATPEEYKEVGEVTSSTGVPTESGLRTVALGYIRRELDTPGREFTIGTAGASIVRASIVRLPLEDLAMRPVDDALLHRAQ